MASKRKNGEGTWGNKTIKGIKYVFYRDSNGKYFYGKTEKEVKQKYKKYKDKSQEDIIDNSILFGDYMSIYIKNKIMHLESTTIDCYEDVINSMLKKYSISDCTLNSLTEDNMRKYIEELSFKYSRASITKVFRIIKPALDCAVENKYIKSNPLKHIKIPNENHVAVKKKIIPFITQDDLDKLYIESKRINVKGYNYGKIGEPTYGNNAQAIVLIANTGLRISELLGLKWEMVDLDNKKIYIKNALVRVKNRDDKENTKYIQKQKQPKSNAGIREIPLSNVALEMIDFFDKQFPNHKPNDFVVLNKNGVSPNTRNIRRTLDLMLVRAGCSISHCGLHGLRHGFGAILLSNGVDIKIVSKLLGHEKISTTYDIYIDFTKEQVENAVMSVLNK